ncbi:MAG: hypothetical protein AAGD38_21420 [Acidobacteriota bacterium]
MMRAFHFLLLIVALLASACAPSSEVASSDVADSEPVVVVDESAVTDSDAPADVVTLAEAWETGRTPDANVDSVAVWYAPEGADYLLATGKETHQLIVYDAATGETLRTVGREGDAMKQLRRPNGVLVLGDLALVVERDNHRVQVFALPSFESLGTFGEQELVYPYGITGEPIVDEGYRLYVTDNYELGGDVADERVEVFDLYLDGDDLVVEPVLTFGNDSDLTQVETLVVDPAHEHLVIADEADRLIRLYEVSGRATGRGIDDGHFRNEPEGIALYECGDRGWWVMTDQHDDVSYFHVFDRVSLEHRGVFMGELTAKTDGVTVGRASTEAFPEGAFYAVNADQSVTAFDWRDIATAFDLTC